MKEWMEREREGEGVNGNKEMKNSKALKLNLRRPKEGVVIVYPTDLACVHNKQSGNKLNRVEPGRMWGPLSLVCAPGQRG